MRLLTALLLALVTTGGSGQGTKQGSPEQNLPAHITRLTHFGERASWYTRVTRWGDYPGFKASNPVVSPDGKRIAFQSARSKDPAGVGYGIFVLQTK